MRWVGIALVGLVCACAAAAPQVGVTPSPSPSALSSVVPFSPPPFKCRLPITLFSGVVRSGAFIDFPSGAVTPDPASAEVNAIPLSGRELTDKTYGLYFDEAYARWLPVYRNAVAPDGAHYAYIDRAISPQGSFPQATLHVVEVKTGIDKTGDGGPWAARFVVVDYASEGIYIRDAGSFGVDLVDPLRDGMHKPDPSIAWYEGSVGNGTYWVDATNPVDPAPFDGIGPDELDNVNPSNGSKVVWFYQPGISVHYLAQDPHGRPIILVTVGETNSEEELLYLPSPGVSREILHYRSDEPPISGPIADSHGVWFGAHDGIYLYTVSDGLRRVSRQAGLPANGCF